MELSDPLVNLPGGDVFTLADAFEGVHITGATGAGKTSASGHTFCTAYMNAGMGGVVMCSKPEERQLWEKYAQETGRTDHLVIVSPNGPYRFNLLDYEMRRGGAGAGHTENLVELLSYITEIAERKVEAGEHEPFWKRAMKEMLRNAIDLISIARGAITLMDISETVTTAPLSVEEANSKKWKDGPGLCATLLREAEAKAGTLTTRRQHDGLMCWNYWMRQFAALSDRTRSSIVAHYTSVADVLLHGAAWEMFATDTTLVPEATFAGAIIVLDWPIQEHHETGRLVQGIWKYMFQRAVLRRDVATHPLPVFLVIDEAQDFIARFDYQFQAKARSARGCTIYMTQSISGYYAILGAHGEVEGDTLLTNFQTKIYHANGDPRTNKYASESIGQGWMFTDGWSGGRGEDGKRNTNYSGSEGLHYKVAPEVFTRLKKGGDANHGQVEAVIFQPGRTFSTTGEPWALVTFQQGAR